MSLNESIVEGADRTDRLSAQMNNPPPQSRTLSTPRDPAAAGLPKLLSGELSVANAREVGHNPGNKTE